MALRTLSFKEQQEINGGFMMGSSPFTMGTPMFGVVNFSSFFSQFSPSFGVSSFSSAAASSPTIFTPSPVSAPSPISTISNTLSITSRINNLFSSVFG